MSTKNINTNTNINKININIPKPSRPRQKKQTQAQVDNAELNLANLENMDGRFVNPSVYGFNRSPLYIPSPIEIQEQPIKTNKGTMTLEEEEEQLREPQSQATSPVSFSSVSPVQAQVFSPRPVMAPVDKSGFTSMGRGLQLPSDFEARLATQEGFQPVQSMSSPFSMYQNPNLANAILRRTSMTSGPDINELRNRMFAVKEAGASNTMPSEAPMEIVVKPKKRGRGKNKPKPITTETQTGPSLNPPVEKEKPRKVKREIQIGGGLRGQSKIEEIDD